MMSDPQLTGYFANFMVEVSFREQSDIAFRRGLGGHPVAALRSPVMWLYYEDMVTPTLVLLIMGLGAQMLAVADRTCGSSHDNRDVGLSTARAPPPGQPLATRLSGPGSVCPARLSHVGRHGRRRRRCSITLDVATRTSSGRRWRQ